MVKIHYPIIPARDQWCTGAGVSESNPAGVLTIFENRSGARVDFSKEEPRRSQFFNEMLVCLYYC